MILELIVVILLIPKLKLLLTLFSFLISSNVISLSSLYTSLINICVSSSYSSSSSSSSSFSSLLFIFIKEIVFSTIDSNIPSLFIIEKIVVFVIPPSIFASSHSILLTENSVKFELLELSFSLFASLKS